MIIKDTLWISKQNISKSHWNMGRVLRNEDLTWWRHQMETFSALLGLCSGYSHVTGEFPAQKPVTRSFGAFFDLCLIQKMSKRWRRRWFETPSRSLWRHCNESSQIYEPVSVFEPPPHPELTKWHPMVPLFEMCKCAIYILIFLWQSKLMSQFR